MKPCDCTERHARRRVVLTGGPGAGKTAVLELIRLFFCEHVKTLPESASIVFGVVVLWTMVDLLPIARFLFTDEGLWLPKMARRNYGGDFRLIWDPEHGVEHWYDWLLAVWYRFSLFHMRADPPFVFTIYAATIAALVLMIPLAVTSTNGMIRRLGRKAWDRLHWLIFPLAILAIAHNLLMVKAIDGDPTIHAVILAALLLWRVGRWGLKRLKPAEAAT